MPVTQQPRGKRSNSREPGEVSSSAKAKAKSETKAEAPEVKAALKAEEKAAKAAARQNKKEADIAASASSSAARKQHGVGLIENKNRSFWKTQNITILKQQAELRGHRFTDLETKGGGVKSKFKKFNRADYLEVLFKRARLKNKCGPPKGRTLLAAASLFLKSN